MEHSTPANDRDFGAGAQPSMPHGPVLYVPPLRIMSPAGAQPFFPPPFNAQNPFNGFHPEMFRQRMDGDPNVKTGRPKPSAVRDFPPGCGRNAGGRDAAGPDPRTHKTQQANANARKSKATQPEVGKQPGAGGEQRDPVGATSPDAAGRNRKRNRRSSSNSDAKKPRRAAGRPGSSGPGGTLSTASSRKAVVETLRLYDAIRRNLLLEEEIKGKEAGKGSRPDLNAGSVINNKGLSVNRSEKVVGSVPGVEVGDQFYFRMEICCIGMHGPIQAGIEYLTAKESEWNTPVAISIISSGGYDDRDDGEVLIYTGQGGKSPLDSKPNEDQKLERGNLAMEGSMKHQVPVRVIRGIKDAVSPSGKTYTYDGLYKVEKCWSEKGKTGFEEFKFRLQRIPGQPELGSAVIKLSNQLRYKPSMREGIRMDDISNGRESVPVCVVNSVDDQQSPAPFEYSTSLQYPSGAAPQQFGFPVGCDCKGVCSASKTCPCFSRNGNAFAYLSTGVLVKEKTIIYECGSHCKCSLNCRNRLTQKGSKYRLEVFKTEDRGWGVRSWDTIPAGSFVCMYTGRLAPNIESVDNKDYLLNLNRIPKNNPRWGDVSKILEKQTLDASHEVPRPELLIDSSQIGNVARFINHSCSPNLLVQCVMQDHHDTTCPHVMLFAMDNIPPFRELTFDYGYGCEVPATESQVQGKECLCRASDCRGRLYH